LKGQALVYRFHQPRVETQNEWRIQPVASLPFAEWKDTASPCTCGRRLWADPTAQSMDEPLLARHAVCHFTRPDDFTIPHGSHTFEIRLISRSPTAHRQKRRRATNHFTKTAIRCRIL
jgi:hypothetical protein